MVLLGLAEEGKDERMPVRRPQKSARRELRLNRKHRTIVLTRFATKIKGSGRDFERLGVVEILLRQRLYYLSSL